MVPWQRTHLPLQEMKETRVQSLGQEQPLEKGMETHSGSLTWRIPWTRGAWRAMVQRVAKSRTQLEQLSTCTAHIIVLPPTN